MRPVRVSDRHGLFRNLGKVVFQHHADDCIFGVVRIAFIEQSNELNATVTVLDIGKDVYGIQVDASHARDGAVSNILIVTTNTGLLARHWRRIGCGKSRGRDFPGSSEPCAA